MASGLTISVESNVKELARSFAARRGLADAKVKEAVAKTLTHSAAKARKDVNAQIPRLFQSVTPRTAMAARYEPADPSKPIDAMRSLVYVEDWKGKKGKGVSPAMYLRAQVLGGTRRDKRSEKAFKVTGHMGAGQQLVPADGQARITGAMMVQILSQTRSFGEQGYRANIGKKGLQKLKDSGVPIHRWLQTTYFLARDKRTGEPIGVWRLVGTGHVEQVLRFVDRRPTYKVRFPFAEMVAKSVRANMPKYARSALETALRHQREGK